MASDLFSKYSCTYCQDEIHGVRVKCVECKDFDLCLQCFSAGAEIGTHKNDHAYQFEDSEALDLFKSKCGWSAREELLLLNGIERYGFGNWEDISLLVKTRTPEECQEEYMTTFVEGTIGRATWSNMAFERRERIPIVNMEDPLSRNSKYIPIDATLENTNAILQVDYMPHRDDFEKEYENDAECLISNLNISSTDDDLDVALKLAQVDMYAQKLRNRMESKRIAREFNLVLEFYNQQKHPNPEQQELIDELKFLCKFLTYQECKSFTASWMREASLRKRAEELARYRSHGITKFEEIPHFEQELAMRDTKSSGRCYSTGAPQLEQPIQPPSTLAHRHLLPPRLSPSHPPQQTRKSRTRHCSDRSMKNETDPVERGVFYKDVKVYNKNFLSDDTEDDSFSQNSRTIFYQDCL